jgi:hypothetical protein
MTEGREGKDAMDCSGLREDLVDVLYDEASPEAARRVEAHLASCGACRHELDSLRRVRHDLSAWKVPEPRPFVAKPSRALRVLAAAAVLLLATGAAFGLSGSEARYESGRVFIRLGPPAGPLREDVGWREALAREEIRHREDVASLQSALRGSAGDTDSVLARVADLIKESEERQERRLDQAQAAMQARAEAQRRYDLARITAGLSYLDGKTGQHVARTTELMGYMLEASQKRSER